MYDDNAMNTTATIAPTTAADYLRSAIGVWESEIKELTAEGIRDGSIVSSTNGNGYEQSHWVHDSKRTYLAKNKVGEYQAEIERGRAVAELRKKIDAARSLMGA
jgi:inosine/xanthosine triphosphate pyrophosphatase family protein